MINPNSQKLQALRSLKRASIKDYGMHLILQGNMTYYTEASGRHGGGILQFFQMNVNQLIL